jgi:hypothetical protein
VDLTTPSRASLVKHQDPITPPNQNRSLNRLVIGGGGGGSNSNGVGSISREASHDSGAQSPTLPAMFSSCVVFLKFTSRVYCLLLLI